VTDGAGPAGVVGVDPSADSTPRKPVRRPVRTLFIGSGRFGQPSLGRLAGHPSVELVGVVTAPPRPVGRRQVETPTPVDRLARELGLRVLAPPRLRQPEALASVLALEPDLVVLADYGQLVPRPLLDRRHGALNLHPSLLPRHRGAAPIPAAILAGDAETGVTLMRMDTGLDTGAIVAIEPAILSGDETAPALEARLAIAAAGLLARSLEPWLAGEIEPVPQAEQGATLTRPLRRADGGLDPRLSALALERQVRAFLPWPGTFVEVDDDRLVVLAASVADPDPDDEPGRFVLDPAGLALATIEGRLVLDEVQPAGGQPMSGDAFLRGRRRILGRAIRSPAGESLPPVFAPALPADPGAVTTSSSTLGGHSTGPA
jgi:methionyl-tRNA formyltransferase